MSDNEKCGILVYVLLLIAAAIPFRYVLMGGRFWKAIGLFWISLIAWAVAISGIIPSSLGAMDRRFYNYFPEMIVVTPILLLGWIYGIIFAGIAVAVRWVLKRIWRGALIRKSSFVRSPFWWLLIISSLSCIMLYFAVQASANASYQGKLTARISIGSKGTLTRNAKEIVEEGRKRWFVTYSFNPVETNTVEKVWTTTVGKRELESMPDVFESSDLILIKFRSFGSDLFKVRTKGGVWKEWMFDEDLVNRFPAWIAAKTEKDKNWFAVGRNSTVDISNRTITVEFRGDTARFLVFRFSPDGEQLSLEAIE